jgi:hypothetical protein
LTTVCGTEGDIRFCGQKQTLICFVFLRLVCIMLPVSLYCPFLIVPSVFSDVYLLNFERSIYL